MAESDTHCYVSRRKCGCFAAIIVDMAAHPKDVAKWAAAELRLGFTLERMPIEDGRKAMEGTKWGPCEHERAARAVTPPQEVLAL